MVFHPDPFTVEVHRTPDHVVLTLHGELDCASTASLQSLLRDVIEEQRNLGVVLDLASLTFVDSAGLSALIYGNRLAREHGVDLTVCSPQPPVRRVLDLTGLTPHLAIVET